MGKIVIINAPSSFTFIWSVVKPWLAKETAAKVDIHGSNYRDALLSLVDAENLPSEFGGSCTCHANGGQCHLSSAGPWMEGRVGRGPNAESVQKQETETHTEIHEAKGDGATVDLQPDDNMTMSDPPVAVSATVEACA